MQLKYGSVPVVIAASAEMAKQFLKTHDHVFATRPQNTAGKYSGRNHSGFLWAPHGPQWRQWRKICLSELFTLKRLECYEYIRVEEMRAFMSSLFASSGKPIVVESKLYCFSISIILRVMLGKKYFSDYSKHNTTTSTAATTIQLEEFRGMLVDFLKLNGAFTIGDWIPWLKFLDLQGYVKQMKALQKKFDKFLILCLRNTRQIWNPKPRDMVGLLLELMNDSSLDIKLTYESVKGFIQDLLVAGTETNSSALEWAMSELMKHPHFIEKATEELDKVIGRDRWVEEKDIPQLHYIEAIVKETLRKHPAAALIPPHAALEDCNVGGDPQMWDAPEEFRPERFLEGRSRMVEIDLKGKSFELIPFGSGRRICPGYGLALKVVTCGLANMLHGFNWSLPYNMKPHDINMEEDKGLTTPRKVPLVAVLEPRLPIHLYHQNHYQKLD
ncbi:hypothetical protein FNV43_RR13307 [Rhamnella rubrinervis]|uniref:Cytochrome P450 n=1 Tax=Rhamnella rubrinervis TaxID=2594499 RepID=A0A8K0MF06_9ROSA|nr:hypothetical protein FNV43_RR13307 [Rhamnella rubrinervis]